MSIRPHWSRFAHHAGESASPGEWRGLLGAWEPSLGNTGLVLRDVSGRGQHGTINELTDTWQLGDNRRLPGYALYFDGADDVNLGTSSLYNFGDGSTDRPFSMSAWVWTDSATTGQVILAKGNFTDDTREWTFSIAANDTFSFVLTDESTGGNINRLSATAISTGRWYYVEGTYDGGGANTGIHLYIDGQLDDGTPGSFLTYTAMENLGDPVFIGQQGNATSFLNGRIGSVRIRNRVRASTESAYTYAQSMRMFQLQEAAFGIVPAAAGGRIMSSLVAHGGLAAEGGIAGVGGGLAG